MTEFPPIGGRRKNRFRPTCGDNGSRYSERPLKKSNDVARQPQLADDSPVSARVGVAGFRDEVGGTVAAEQGSDSTTRHLMGAGFTGLGLAFTTGDKRSAGRAANPDTISLLVVELLGLLATGPWLSTARHSPELSGCALSVSDG